MSFSRKGQCEKSEKRREEEKKKKSTEESISFDK